ncbi:hypothetical protein V2J91_26490 [Pseudomonas alliivorans]|nr:hypothetical protein [Pseudomonas alliivorans]MEE5149642.1 hypothetical protein [Pseudomonas alliivorans]
MLLEIGGERTLGDPSRIALLMSRFDTSDDKHSGFCFVKGCIEGKENERESLSASFEDTEKKALISDSISTPTKANLTFLFLIGHPVFLT